MRKKLTAMLIGSFLFATAPFTLAQHGAGTHYPAGGHLSPSDSQRASMIRAGEDQRIAFAMCRNSGESVHKIADQMVGPGTRWRYDEKVFPTQKERLEIALAVMSRAHQQFRETLSEAQKQDLVRNLGKLERLQNALSQRMAQLDEELRVDKPDPRRVYADTHKIKEIADKWRSEHKKIAKEMSIADSRA